MSQILFYFRLFPIIKNINLCVCVCVCARAHTQSLSHFLLLSQGLNLHLLLLLLWQVDSLPLHHMGSQGPNKSRYWSGLCAGAKVCFSGSGQLKLSRISVENPGLLNPAKGLCLYFFPLLSLCFLLSIICDFDHKI